MKLFYAPQSPFARKVRAAAIELGLDQAFNLNMPKWYLVDRTRPSPRAAIHCAGFQRWLLMPATRFLIQQ